MNSDLFIESNSDIDGFLGYIKYDGKGLERGIMDARKQADALLGMDHALRHFIVKLNPALKGIDFEIPVKVREGSWEALIPETVSGWVQASLGIAATAYLTQAAQKMAERDFDEFGVKDIFSKALAAIKWFARLGKHLGRVEKKPFEDVKFADNNNSIGIKNDAGEYLYIPKYILDLYIQSDPKVLEGLVSLVIEGRSLKIGDINGTVVDEVTITEDDKYIFCDEENEDLDEPLFPELRHGENVVLEGEVTRENKTSNSMGFKYLDHILTAYPETGSIVRYKPLLFLRCRLFGTVDRTDEKGRTTAKRPKLYFSHLEALEVDEGDDLFRGI